MSAKLGQFDGKHDADSNSSFVGSTVVVTVVVTAVGIWFVVIDTDAVVVVISANVAWFIAVVTVVAELVETVSLWKIIIWQKHQNQIEF